MVDAIAPRVAERRVGLKWPNDVYIDGKKAAGILSEAQVEGGHAAWIVVGIGINVRTSTFPDELTARATSLAMAGATSLDRGDLFVDLASALFHRIEMLREGKVSELVAAFAAKDELAGRAITVEGAPGTALGIAEDGALMIRRPDGKVEKCVAGEVRIADDILTLRARRVAMPEIPMYHRGSRELQDRFGSRRLADRLASVLSRDAFTDEDRAFIESRRMFFLATADADGRPECSYKGGDPGFVRIVDSRTLAFPSYDGNGMFKSLGNVLVNPHVGLLFIDFENPKRLRVNGRASIDLADPLLNESVGADLIVRVEVEAIFPNCPRYVHRLQMVERSVYTPTQGTEPPEPGWKRRPEFREVLPPKRK